LLNSIYEYTGQSDISENITNRRRRFVAQLLCNPNSLVQYFASVMIIFIHHYMVENSNNSNIIIITIILILMHKK